LQDPAASGGILSVGRGFRFSLHNGSICRPTVDCNDCGLHKMEYRIARTSFKTRLAVISMPELRGR
jgi:hypothetical protein